MRDSLENYVLASGLYLTLMAFFRIYKYWLQSKGLWVVLALLTFSVNAQGTHYPLVKSEQVIQVGTVNTVELYHKSGLESGKQYLIFYNHEGEARWAAIEVYKKEISEFYSVMSNALVQPAATIQFRGTTIHTLHPVIGKATVDITDDFGQKVSFKITRRELEKLFSKK